MSEFKTGQQVYVRGPGKDPIRTTIKRATKIRATVSIDGVDVVFHLRGTKGREEGRGRSFRLVGYQAEDREIGGNRRIEDAYETDRQAEKSAVFELLRALEDRTRGASLQGLRVMRKYLGDFL